MQHLEKHAAFVEPKFLSLMYLEKSNAYNTEAVSDQS